MFNDFTPARYPSVDPYAFELDSSFHLRRSDNEDDIMSRKKKKKKESEEKAKAKKETVDNATKLSVLTIDDSDILYLM